MNSERPTSRVLLLGVTGPLGPVSRRVTSSSPLVPFRKRSMGRKSARRMKQRAVSTLLLLSLLFFSSSTSSFCQLASRNGDRRRRAAIRHDHLLGSRQDPSSGGGDPPVNCPRPPRQGVAKEDARAWPTPTMYRSSQRREEYSLLLSRRASVSIVSFVATLLPVIVPSSPASSAKVPASVIQNEEEAPDTCANGALAQETSIPGAYQQDCMNRSERTIPVLRTTTTSSRHIEAGAACDDDEEEDHVEPGIALHETKQREEVVWLTIGQYAGGVGAGSTGRAVWNSGLLLSRLLQRLATSSSSCPSWFLGKTVLELGCGVGLGSLTCAVLGADRVWATDGNPDVVELATQNANINRLQTKVFPRILPWGLLPAMDYSDAADVVIGSDLTYNAGTWRVLAETMGTVLKPDGYVLYVSAGHAGFQVNAEVDGFLAVAKEHGLVSVVSKYDPLWPFGWNASSGAAGRTLSEILLQDCLQNEREREIVENTGGVRAVLLTHRRRNPS